MDPTFLLLMSSFLQLQQLMAPSSFPGASASGDAGGPPLLFFLLSCVVAHAAAICSEGMGMGMDSDPWGLRLLRAHITGAPPDPAIRDRQWRERCGLSYPLFSTLVQQLAPFIRAEALSMPPDSMVAMALHRLSQGHTSRALAAYYSTQPWIVTRVTNMVTKALSTKLYHRYISIPEGPSLVEAIQGFQDTTGLPNMCGAIDGSHVRICKMPNPEYSPEFYKCSHGYYSVLMQAVCDHRRLFWDVCVKAPGATEDAMHLRASSLYHKLIKGNVLGGSIVTVRGNHIRPYIVGDCCYPLLSFLLTPFSAHGSGSSSQNLFDSCLMRGRRSIVEAIGLLKGRWQMLQNLNVGLKHAPQTIVACCVLHNMCQSGLEPEPPFYNDPTENGIPARPLDTEKSNHYFGESIRQALVEDLQERQQRNQR